MKVVRHHNELVNEVFLLIAVVEENINKQEGILVYLKQALLEKSVCGNEIG